MAGAPAATRESAILALWEETIGADRPGRTASLLAAAGLDATATLGAGHAALLRLRGQWFGRLWPLRAACPACAADCEFTADVSEIAHRLAADGPARAHGSRPLTFADLASVAAARTSPAAARALVVCALGADPDVAAPDEAVLAAFDATVEALDPGAVVSFALACPACAHGWSAPIDVCAALWREVRAAAEASILEVDALAREYGWRESDVLALSPARRAAYLQLAEAR